MAAAAGEVPGARDATTVFGHLTTVMAVRQAMGPSLAGALADATGAVDSGLGIATLAAVAGVG